MCILDLDIKCIFFTLYFLWRVRVKHVWRALLSVLKICLFFDQASHVHASLTVLIYLRFLKASLQARRLTSPWGHRHGCIYSYSGRQSSWFLFQAISCEGLGLCLFSDDTWRCLKGLWWVYWVISTNLYASIYLENHPMVEVMLLYPAPVVTPISEPLGFKWPDPMR